MARLLGKVIIVTGASRGIGRALANGLAQEGARLVVTARPRSEQTLDAIARSIAERCGTEIMPICADVNHAAQCESLIEKALMRFGAVHALINNAGIGMDRVGPRTRNERGFHRVPVAIWKEIVEANINGPFLMSRAVMPAFIAARRGRIINVTTSYDTMLREGFSPYGPCKLALEGLSVVWAKELADTGIFVNSLCPGGATDTRMMPHEDFPDRSKLLSPGVMVPPAVWLCSDASEGVTGTRIVAKEWNDSLGPKEAFRRASMRLEIQGVPAF